MTNRLIAALTLTLILLAGEAVASYCTQTVIHTPTGAIICTSCCFYGSCTTNCT